MLLSTIVAFANADVGNYEVQSLDYPVVNDAAFCSPCAEYVLHDYADFSMFAVEAKTQYTVPSPMVCRLPSFLMSDSDLALILLNNNKSIDWRHRAFGEIGMNLRFTSYTYKR